MVPGAQERIDRVINKDIDSLTPTDFDGQFDLIVLGDVLEHLRNPERALKLLNDVSVPNAVLVACVPVMTHASIIEGMLMGDITYDDSGLLDRTHLRFMSIASTIKLMLDGGWLPNINGINCIPHTSTPFIEALLAAGKALNIPESTVRRNTEAFQAYFTCVKAPKPAQQPRVPFSVVVAVTNEAQFNRNVLASPGLKEINARVIPIWNATSAADALERGAKEAGDTWIVYCHQDVYFPSGSGAMIAEHLASATPDDFIGFVGMGLDRNNWAYASGLVIDRLGPIDFPPASRAISADEFAVALHAGGRVKADARFGWHLWATDLCLQNVDRAKIVRVPLFHNSCTENGATQALKASQQHIASKYRGSGIINTLTGPIQT